MEPVEEMRAFFTKRVNEYEEHMLTQVEGILEAYALVASLLPEGMRTLLNLGCGTGLELDGVFARFPEAHVTGIDMTQAMLDVLARKHPPGRLTLICGDYMTADFGEDRYDAALSFQTMHHFPYAQKRALYGRVRRALRAGGVYVEADYTVPTQAEEDMHFREKDRQLADMGNPPGVFHWDTPMTPENQRRLLREAGFADVRLARGFAYMSIFVAAE